MRNKKKVNKILVWVFLWTALWWLGIFSRTKKWKSLFWKIKSDLKAGFKEMKITFQTLKKKYAKKKK